MDVLTVSKKVLNFLVPFLKSRAAKEIGSDFSEAFNNEALEIWKKIKPILIKEEILEDLEGNPTDENIQNGFNYILSKKLEKNPGLTLEIISMLNSIKSSEGSKIVNQSHTGSGDNVAGDKIIYGGK